MTPHVASILSNRFVLSLFITACIGLFAGAVYLLVKYGHHIGAVLRNKQVILAYRIVMTVAAVVCMILSFMPRADLEMGGILFFFLWPLLIAQGVVGLLPWGGFMQKHGTNAVVAALALGMCAYFTDSFVLHLAGYLGS